MIEIRCPGDCSYLSSGQGYHRFKDFIAQLQTLESLEERRLFWETSLRYERFLDELEKGVVEYASDLRSLDDRQIGEAVSALRDTYRTESKGIIYEHVSPNPLVQALARKLREKTEEYRSKSESDHPPMGPAQVVDCLRVLQLNVSHYSKGGGKDYLNLIRRSHPEVAGKGAEGGGLISL